MCSDLLPCPFCGDDGERIDMVEGGSFIHCMRCDASTAIHFDRKENLTGSWNNRKWPSRDGIAKGLAKLDGITLLNIRSTVGPTEDANNWREYLGRADDLLAHLSAEGQ